MIFLSVSGSPARSIGRTVDCGGGVSKAENFIIPLLFKSQSSTAQETDDAAVLANAEPKTPKPRPGQEEVAKVIHQAMPEILTFLAKYAVVVPHAHRR